MGYNTTGSELPVPPGNQISLVSVVVVIFPGRGGDGLEVEVEVEGLEAFAVRASELGGVGGVEPLGGVPEDEIQFGVVGEVGLGEVLFGGEGVEVGGDV